MTKIRLLNKVKFSFTAVPIVMHRVHHAMDLQNRNVFSASQIDFRLRENVLLHVQMAFMAIKRGKSAFR